ncbi:MAG TPA: bacillithiol biosynthesis BshC, partial [Mucilaginibacter sp.]
MDAACINYKDTGYFSQTVTDYLENAPQLRPFYSYRPDINGFAEFLKVKKVIADREILVSVLSNQYAKIYENSKVSPLTSGGDLEGAKEALSLLKSDNTYTITTGHQLNIFAGPLYF